MVDLAHSIGHPDRHGSTREALARSPVAVTVVSDREDVMTLIDGVGGDDICTGYQHPSFLRAFIEHGGGHPVFILVETGRAGRVLLPLEDHGNGVATYVGGRHANGNFPVGSAAALESLAAIGAINAISQATSTLKSAGIDTIALERQHAIYRGVANPFVGEQSAISPNVALSMTLGCDFDAVLERVSGSRKRKKFRNQMRKLEALGAVSEIIPVTVEETGAALDRFFALKAERFREAGIADVFSDEATRAAFHALFDNGAKAEPATHEIHMLTVGDKTAAVMGCTTIDKRLIVEFSSFDPEFAHAGPGDLLFFLAIRNACERHFEIFDFGVGDEPFKRSWCDTETWHRDTVIAVSLKGRVIAAAKQARTSAVRHLKTNTALWRLAKAARKRLAGFRSRP